MLITLEGADGNKSTIFIDDETGAVSQAKDRGEALPEVLRVALESRANIKVEITYTFGDRDKSTVTLDGHIGVEAVLNEEATRKSNRAESRRHTQLSTMTYEGELFEDTTADVPTAFLEKYTLGQLKRAIATLAPKQQDLVRKVFWEKRTYESIAEEEGKTGPNKKQAIYNRLQKILRKLRKQLEKNLDPDN